MELSEAKKAYIFTTKIMLDGDDFIVLREPTSFELKDFSDDGRSNVEILQKLLPKAIIDSSFTEEGKPAAGVKVAAMLLDSGTQFSKIIEQWMEDLPLQKKTDSKLDK